MYWKNGQITGVQGFHPTCLSPMILPGYIIIYTDLFIPRENMIQMEIMSGLKGRLPRLARKYSGCHNKLNHLQHEKNKTIYTSSIGSIAGIIDKLLPERYCVNRQFCRITTSN